MRKPWENVKEFINIKRESRHLKTLECQKSKFERLCKKKKKNTGGCSNIKHGGNECGCSNIHN